MRRTLLALAFLAAVAALAAPAPFPVTVNSRAQTAPPLTVYRANESLFRVQFTDGFAGSDVSAYHPFLAWATSSTAVAVSTAAVQVVGASTGLVDFTFSPASVNFAAGRYLYEVGLRTTNGVPRVYRQGAFTILGSPTGGGAGAVTWTTGVDWESIEWSNLPDWALSSELDAEAVLRAAVDAALLASNALARAATAQEAVARAAGDAAVAAAATNYADFVASGIGAIYYGTTNAATADATYLALSSTPPADAVTVAFSGITNGAYIGTGWLTPDTLPSLRDGVYDVHYHLNWTTRSHPSATFKTKAEIYIWDSVGVVTQEVESATYQTHTYGAGMTHYDGFVTVPADILRSAPFRLVVKLKAQVNSTYTVGGTIGIGGGTQSCLQFPAPAGFFATQTALDALGSAISNGFLRVIQVTPGVWQHVLPGE